VSIPGFSRLIIFFSATIAVPSQGIAHFWQNFSTPLSSNDFALNDFAFSLRLPSFAALRLNSFCLLLRDHRVSAV